MTSHHLGICLCCGYSLELNPNGLCDFCSTICPSQDFYTNELDSHIFTKCFSQENITEKKHHSHAHNKR